MFWTEIVYKNEKSQYIKHDTRKKNDIEKKDECGMYEKKKHRKNEIVLTVYIQFQRYMYKKKDKEKKVEKLK